MISFTWHSKKASTMFIRSSTFFISIYQRRKSHLFNVRVTVLHLCALRSLSHRRHIISTLSIPWQDVGRWSGFRISWGKEGSNMVPVMWHCLGYFLPPELIPEVLKVCPWDSGGHLRTRILSFLIWACHCFMRQYPFTRACKITKWKKVSNTSEVCERSESFSKTRLSSFMEGEGGYGHMH